MGKNENSCFMCTRGCSGALLELTLLSSLLETLISKLQNSYLDICISMCVHMCIFMNKVMIKDIHCRFILSKKKCENVFMCVHMYVYIHTES